MKRFPSILMFLLLALSSGSSLSQAVQVTMALDKPKVQLGESATLRVYGQIAAAQRPASDRIFGWYVDLLNTASTVGAVDPATLTRATSDKDPRTSSSGTVEGPNIRGIYDTFINLPGAGRDTPVELFAVTIRPAAIGKTTLQVRAGSTVANMDVDFLVAPLDGGDPFTGGDYTAANIEFEVIAGLEPPRLAVSMVGAPGQKEISIAYPVVAGASYFIEYQDSLNPSGAWQLLPGSPHNSGQVTDPVALGNRFYRLRIAQ